MNSTALDELIQWIDHKTTSFDCIVKAKELMEKERRQIIDALMYRREDGMNLEEAEEYYRLNFTFEGQYEIINNKKLIN